MTASSMDAKDETPSSSTPHVSFPANQPSEMVTPAPQQRESSGGSSTLRQRRKPPKFRNVAKMVSEMSRRSLTSEVFFGGGPGSNNSSQDSGGVRSEAAASAVPEPYHRRYHSTSQLVSKTETPLSKASIPMFNPSTSSETPTSTLWDHAQHLENLFQKGPSDTFSDITKKTPISSRYKGLSLQTYERIPESDGEEDEDGGRVHHRQDPSSYRRISALSDLLYSPNEATASTQSDTDDVEQGQDVGQTTSNDLFAQDTTPLMNNKNQDQMPARRTVKVSKRYWNTFKKVLRLQEVAANIRHFIGTTFFLFIVPCMAAAAIFYYPLENPDLEFLPTQARLAWYLLFATRQSVTFTLARISVWCLQVLTIRTTFFVKLAGPFLALAAMQSLGWPALMSAWGSWNLLLLHGDSPFVKHWLYFTGIRLFSIEYNAGGGILASQQYGRFLAAMIVFGVASAIKRTLVALYLSRRMLQNYRTQLESVMIQVHIIAEVAALAEQTEDTEFDKLLANANEIAVNQKSRFVETVPIFNKTEKGQYHTAPQHRDLDHCNGEDDDDDSLVSADGENPHEPSSKYETSKYDPLEEVMNEPEDRDIVDVKVHWNQLKQRAMNDRYPMNLSPSNDGAAASRMKGHHRSSASSTSGMNLIYPFLERWQEPEDKGKKEAAPSLHDILIFKKALHHLQKNYPFSRAYGSASNRKLCVKNSVRVYRKLLRFTPDQEMLSFDVIGALAYQEDGSLDEDRALDLLRVFQPDKDDKLPMLAFVQSCDHVYKQLRFLRAALSNSSKIDSVLLNIFNLLFYSIVAIMIMEICGFNPWPLLVSLSTLTVSGAFAFGPSVAKNVEGILLIAVRRPYDIGDRITITGAEQVGTPAYSDTWLVEDTTLTTTTLRYAATNEVATINNASVSNSRIVNCSRSPKATVTIRVRFDVETSQRQLDDFRKKLEAYLEDRPRQWVGLVHSRMEAIDSDAGYCMHLYRAQHVKSWQDLGAIMIHKGELERFADAQAREMGIIFESPPPQMRLGVGLAPEEVNDKVIDDRRRVADFVRSVSAGGDEQIYGPVSEFFGAAEGAPPAALDPTVGDKD